MIIDIDQESVWVLYWSFTDPALMSLPALLAASERFGGSAGGSRESRSKHAAGAIKQEAET